MIKITNTIGQFTDEFVEQVVKGVPREAKTQIFGSKPNEKISDVTGKPVPTKKALTQLSQATDQLQAIKLKKMREELARMKLQVTENKSLAGKEGQGPEMPTEKPKKHDNIVEQTLKNARSTGEIRGGGG